ncbi:MAG: sugar ABC transporter permease [Devosia sp.]|nr:sugar ABC transporter permease [Devosia sp.]
MRAISPAVRGWLLCVPALAIFGCFFIAPAVVGIVVSLHAWNGSSPHMQFIGLGNYVDLFGDGRFLNALGVTVAAFVGMVVIKLPLAILVAVGLDKTGRMAKVYRTSVFLPYVLSTTTVAIIWIFLFDPYQGLINQLLKGLSLGALQQGWLGQSSTALPIVIAGGVWWTFGLYVVLFTAALAAIPRDYYDAAKLDTNSSFEVLIHITVPLLREQIFTSTVMMIGGVLGYMTGFILLLTSGGPAGHTETLGLLGQALAFRALDFGHASAVSVIVLIIVFSLIIVPTVRIARTRIEFR